MISLFVDYYFRFDVCILCLFLCLYLYFCIRTWVCAWIENFAPAPQPNAERNKTQQPKIVRKKTRSLSLSLVLYRKSALADGLVIVVLLFCCARRARIWQYHMYINRPGRSIRQTNSTADGCQESFDRSQFELKYYDCGFIWLSGLFTHHQMNFAVVISTISTIYPIYEYKVNWCVLEYVRWCETFRKVHTKSQLLMVCLDKTTKSKSIIDRLSPETSRPTSNQECSMLGDFIRKSFFKTIHLCERVQVDFMEISCLKWMND